MLYETTRTTYPAPRDGVLILILMEYALWDTNLFVVAAPSVVLILILMEYALWAVANQFQNINGTS